MPSWYEEGIACFFGHERSMTVKDGRLATGLKPTAAVLAPLIAGGRLRVPLEELLHGDAAQSIAADDGSGGKAEATALFDRVFADAGADLESGFAAWLADPQ